MVNAEVKGTKINYDGRNWITSDAMLKQAAEDYSDVYQGEPAASQYHPDPDRALVAYVMEALGGNIVDSDDPGPGCVVSS